MSSEKSNNQNKSKSASDIGSDIAATAFGGMMIVGAIMMFPITLPIMALDYFSWKKSEEDGKPYP